MFQLQNGPRLPQWLGAQDVEVQEHALGQKIRSRRRLLKRTLQEVALSVGISRSHLLQIERTRAAPSLSMLEAIARALDVSPDDFFAPAANRHQRAALARLSVARPLHLIPTTHLDECVSNHENKEDSST